MKYPFFIFFFFLVAEAGNAQQVRDTSFWQEYHEAFPLQQGAAENEIRSIAIDNESTLWVATPVGVFSKKENDADWQPVLNTPEQGPSFAVAADDQSDIWMGTWKGVYRSHRNEITMITGTEGPVSALCNAKEG